MAGNDVKVWGWTDFFEEVVRMLEDCGRFYYSANLSYANYVVDRLETCTSSLSRLIVSMEQNSLTELDCYERIRSLLATCLLVLDKWEWLTDTRDLQLSTSAYRAPTGNHEVACRGRPQFSISREQLVYLSSLSFSWSDIARMLGVSRMTIYRRRLEYGLVRDPNTSLSDLQLRLVLREVKQQNPELGEIMVMGRIRAMGYKVARERLRQEIRQMDPLHTALRWRHQASRRPYSVRGPNSLWHIDGHHKLIRWGFVTHAGIDGFSRMIVYMKCSTNNRSTTVYGLFLEAVQSFGLPSRVRSDQGRENVVVARHMIECRGVDRRSMITGSSVHNQRIERLWRDMHRCAIKFYYRLFYFMEDRLFNPSDSQHIYTLHYVYKPRINKTLLEFRDGWNQHGIRTAQGKTPHQLFTAGALELRYAGIPSVDFFEDVNNTFGIDEEEDYPALVDDSGINIPECAFVLEDTHFSSLQQEVDPLQSSDNFGIDLYLQALNFVSQIIHDNPTIYN